MDRQRKIRNRLTVLTLLTICFIWGNSLLPGTVSGAFSDWARDVLNALLGGLVHEGPLSGGGLLRKVAHGTEFALLGSLLVGLCRYGLDKGWSHVLLAGLSVALIDETIQLFVAGRAGQIQDVWIDMLGFAIGCILTSAFLRWKRRGVDTPESNAEAAWE